MVDFKSIDQRTSLAGTNRLELLMFKLNDIHDMAESAMYGINVFKVREIIESPELVKVPQSSEFVAGIANIRGSAIPVIDLGLYLGCDYGDKRPGILIVTEFNRSTQGFLIHQVEQIIQLDWNEIHEPPALIQENHNNTLTAMSLIEDEKMLLILDVEKVISDVLGSKIDLIEATDMTLDNKGRKVFFADDSLVARTQISRILDKMGIEHQSAKSGLEALEALHLLADEAESEGHPLSQSLAAIITDVEMPEMDGYVLTGKIKSDRRFSGIPVMMHTSLSASENLRLGMKVGADAYIPKLKPDEFSKALDGLLRGKRTGFEANPPQ